MPGQKILSINVKALNSYSMCSLTHDRVQLELSNRNISGLYPNVCKLSNIFLNNTSIREIKHKKIIRYSDPTENENKRYQSLGHLPKGMSMGKFSFKCLQEK